MHNITLFPPALRTFLVLTVSVLLFGLHPLFGADQQTKLLSPSRISFEAKRGNEFDAVEARQRLMEWLEAKRNSEEYGDNHDSNYRSAADIIQEADGEEAVDAFLRRELSLTESRRSKYAILDVMAKRMLHAQKYEDAVGLWEEAREVMMSGTHPYYVTRQALPLKSIANLYLQLDNQELAKVWLEKYCETEYSKSAGISDFLKLGELYEESGEWDKARVLYENCLQHTSLKNSSELRRRLKLPDTTVLANAEKLLTSLRSSSEKERRLSRNKMFFLIQPSDESEAWIRWLTRISSQETHPEAKLEVKRLLALLTPLREIGGEGFPERREQMEIEEKRDRVYQEVYSSLFSEFFENSYEDVGQILIGEGAHTLRGLSSSNHFSVEMEKIYSEAKVLALYLENEKGLHEKVGDVPLSSSIDEVRDVFSENGTFRSFLRTCVSLKSQTLGFAYPFLYALGNKEDIDHIIANIPEDHFSRNWVMLHMAILLERERILDIPHILGLDKEHVRDWWNLGVPGASTQERFRQWWEKSRATFHYDSSDSPGKLIFAGNLLALTSFVSAPELDGAFFFVEGGFRGYFGDVYFFQFESGRFGSLTGKGRENWEGPYASAASKWRKRGSRIDRLHSLAWNSEKMRCEFSIAQDSRVGIRFSEDGNTVEDVEVIPDAEASHAKEEIRLGPGIQRVGDFTYELRLGDLFVVDERTGAEECIESFGYIQSFNLNQTGTKILALHRGILSPSLSLYDTEDSIGSLFEKRR